MILLTLSPLNPGLLRSPKFWKNFPNFVKHLLQFVYLSAYLKISNLSQSIFNTGWFFHCKNFYSLFPKYSNSQPIKKSNGNTPVLAFSSTFIFQYRHFPVLTFSSTVIFQYCRFPVLSFSSTGIFSTDIFQYRHFQYRHFPVPAFAVLAFSSTGIFSTGIFHRLVWGYQFPWGPPK